MLSLYSDKTKYIPAPPTNSG